MAEFSAFLLALQVIMHTFIALRLAAYQPSGDCSYRPGVSTLAAMLAGSSAVSAYDILTHWPALVEQTSQPFTTLFVAVVLAGILKSRGNLAYFIQR